MKSSRIKLILAKLVTATQREYRNHSRSTQSSITLVILIINTGREKLTITAI